MGETARERNGERSNGVLEYWSIAPSRNCTPRPRGWECFQRVFVRQLRHLSRGEAAEYLLQAAHAWTSKSRRNEVNELSN
jgi:hypothetical protein